MRADMGDAFGVIPAPTDGVDHAARMLPLLGDALQHASGVLFGPPGQPARIETTRSIGRNSSYGARPLGTVSSRF